MHGENLANSKGAKNYERTPWGRALMPRSPDVPASLERALGRRELLHFISWDAAAADPSSQDLLWDQQPSTAPIEKVEMHCRLFRVTSGPCSNRQGCG